MTLAPELARGLAELDLNLDPATQHKLLAYLALLEKWNQVYNLTAVRKPQQMLYAHLLDSLAVLPYLPAGTTVDVGSGAGLPGIPIALARPGTPITLLDSNHKKASFLREAVMQLGLENITVVCQRVEEFSPAEKFAVVISRAFSDLAEFLRLTRHLCAPGGKFLAMKGLLPYEELNQLPADITLADSRPLHVPGIEGQRHLLTLGPA